jgi:hypothetical protein
MSCNIAQSCKNACHFLEIFGQNVKMLGIWKLHMMSTAFQKTSCRPCY